VLELLTGLLNFVRQEQPDLWHRFIDDVALLSMSSQTTSSSPSPQIELEQMYQNTQNELIQIRQAVAQAIATQKHLERQVDSNRDQAKIWQQRADMARNQRNGELAEQADQKNKQYVMAGEALEQQLREQTTATAVLRERLTDVEGLVHRLYTKTQVLIARDKAAAATLNAHEILSKFNGGEAMAAVEAMERKVAEREQQLPREGFDTTLSSPLNSEELLSHAIVALDRATSVMERLERAMTNNAAKATVQVEPPQPTER
jgi:phage shock protein A